jgi:hypothetical protein
MLMMLILGENINTWKKSIEALLDTNKEVGLEVNTKKSFCSRLVTKMQDIVI